MAVSGLLQARNPELSRSVLESAARGLFAYIAASPGRHGDDAMTLARQTAESLTRDLTPHTAAQAIPVFASALNKSTEPSPQRWQALAALATLHFLIAKPDEARRYLHLAESMRDEAPGRRGRPGLMRPPDFSRGPEGGLPPEPMP